MVTLQRPCGVTSHEPVRLHHHRLMHQLKTTLRIADRFDGERPPGGRLIGDHSHVDPQPLVDQAEIECLVQIQLGVQSAQSLLDSR